MTTLAIVLLLIINGFFVAAEFALVKVPVIRINSLAEEGHFLAKLTKMILSNLEAYLAACQLGITMASLGLGWIGEPAVAALLHPWFSAWGMTEDTLHLVSFLTGFILFSSLHIVVGEQVPKTYAIRVAPKVAMWSAIPLIAFYWCAFPLNWALNKASSLILRMMGVKAVTHVEVLTGSEISGLIDASIDHGVIGAHQAEMLQNLFRFDERVVHSIMLPRSEIQTLEYTASIPQILETLKTTRHSRLPVIDGSWDELKGVVIVRDLLVGYVTNNELLLDDFLRPPQLVPESQAIRLLFDQMRISHDHLAFAVDEFGQIDGIVTLEDLLEEVVGEIVDESDFDELPHSIVDRDGGWQVHGRVPLHDLLKRTRFYPEPQVSASTVSGYLMQRLQKIPVVDDIWEESGFKFTVTKIEGSRVEEIYLEVISADDPDMPE